MASTALLKWRSERAARLERLLAAHRAVRRVHRGRWVTDELNHSLILRLASEFQGFARSLHDEASVAVTRALAPGDVARQQTLRIPYQNGRRLDRGNAQPGALNEDFTMFGMELWPDLDATRPW
jgi:hypothetical protein